MTRLTALLIALSLASCGVPRDPEGTLERVRGGEMRVGVSSSDPWATWPGDAPSGVEVDLVEDFAADVDSEVVWVEGSEAELIEALEVGELDLVIGGLTSTSPWSKVAALTHPYITTKVVVAVPGVRRYRTTSRTLTSRSRGERQRPASSRRRMPIR